MIRVVINGRFLLQPITGVQRYARELILEVDKLLQQDEDLRKKISFEILMPRGQIFEPESFVLAEIPCRKVGWGKGHIWEQLQLPFFVNGASLFNLCNLCPMLSLLTGQNCVVTVHDVSIFLAPQFYHPIFVLWYRLVLKTVFSRAKLIISVSNHEREQMQLLFPHIPGKLRTVHSGIRLPSDAAQSSPKDAPPKFILFVGSLNPRKNLSHLIQAVALLNEKGEKIPLVVVGACAEHFGDLKLDKSPAQYSFIQWRSKTNDQELDALYRQATLMILPSFYEGFGFPPLEAMARGCPVVVSDTTCLPEIVGNAGLYCDPASISNIAKKIEHLWKDKELQDRMKQLGFERVKNFTWDKAAKETLALLIEFSG